MNTYTNLSQNEERGANGDYSESQSEKHSEGPIARRIEQQTAKIPSDVFLWAAGGAMVLSLGMEIVGMVQARDERFGIFGGRSPKRSAPLASFIGHWVPTLLLLGVYNKIVKVAGSDRKTR